MNWTLDLDPWVLVPLMLVFATAGLVRGFAGFGAGLIMMPIASAIIDPRLAAAVFLVTDTLMALPMIPPAVKKANWPTVLPAALGAMLIIPVGTYVLVNADVLTLRWGLSALILCMLVLLMSGWRYQGAPKWFYSVGVGGIAGFFGGVAQVSGPPVVTYWMSGPSPAAVIRANLISFFAIATIASAASYWQGGLFTLEAFKYVLFCAPVYGAGLFIGANGFARSGDTYYRYAAYSLIAISAISSLPALDHILRP